MKISIRQTQISIHPQILVLSVIWLFTLAYFLHSKDLSTKALLFPRFLFLGIIVSGSFVLYESITIKKQPSDKDQDLNTFIPSLNQFYPSRKLFLFWLVSVLAIVVFGRIHALLSIGICSFLLLIVTGVKKKTILVIVPLTLVLFIYSLFVRWLSVPLPNIFH